MRTGMTAAIVALSALAGCEPGGSSSTGAAMSTDRASTAAVGATASDEAEIKRVIQAFIDTRETNDEAALRALLTSDADQLQTSGNLRSGRDAVVTGSLATTQSTGGKRTITVDQLRFVGPDVALADGRYDSLGRSDGTDQHMLTSIVLRREQGAWKIAAIRNMIPTSR